MAMGVHVGVAGPLPPSDLRRIGPSTLLKLGRGSPPVLNRVVGAHVGVAWPLPPSDLRRTGLLVLSKRSSPLASDTVCFGRPVVLSIEACAKREDM